MKFEKTCTVGLRDIGITNKLTNYGILSYLEDIAVEHSDTVGYGVKDIKIKNRAWLLMDWKLKINERPEFGEKIYIKTWAVKSEKYTIYSLRNFEFYNEQNICIGSAVSKWILFDTENEKIIKLNEDLISLYNPEEQKVEVSDELLRLKEPVGHSSEFIYTIKRADIDINNHLHNLNYLKLAYEALPEDVYFSYEMNNVRIMYKNEIKLYDTVKCLYSNENGKHIIAIKSEDEKILHAIIELF